MISTGEWMIRNILLLRAALPECDIEFDGEDGTWVRVCHFPLPNNIEQLQTDLLILMPGIHYPVTMAPRSFYLDQNLRSSATGFTPAHIFERAPGHGWEDLTNRGYANFCLILSQWQPTPDVVSGDNLLSVVNTVFMNLSEL